MDPIYVFFILIVCLMIYSLALVYFDQRSKNKKKTL